MTRREHEDNPVYGTAKVLMATEEIFRNATDPERAARMLQRGAGYLIDSQNTDGGWGGGSSVTEIYRLRTGTNWTSTVEETALALEGLIDFRCSLIRQGGLDGVFVKPEEPESDSEGKERATGRLDEAILVGSKWLCEAVDNRLHETSFPIGFYFAKLWYHERLYPLIYSASALGRLMSQIDQFDPDTNPSADHHATSS